MRRARVARSISCFRPPTSRADVSAVLRDPRHAARAPQPDRRPRAATWTDSTDIVIQYATPVTTALAQAATPADPQPLQRFVEQTPQHLRSDVHVPCGPRSHAVAVFACFGVVSHIRPNSIKKIQDSSKRPRECSECCERGPGTISSRPPGDVQPSIAVARLPAVRRGQAVLPVLVLLLLLPVSARRDRPRPRQAPRAFPGGPAALRRRCAATAGRDPRLGRLVRASDA